MVQHDHDIGHADSAAYALQGRSLAWHGSLTVPYVSTFFHLYPRSIERLDDHWPPFLAFLLGPAFRIWGVSAVVAHAVCMGIGAVALPLAAAVLATLCCHRIWAGLAAGLLMLVDPFLLANSLIVLGDVSLAALLLLFAAAVVAGRQRPAWLLAAGGIAAAATYAKGSSLMLPVLLPVLAVAACGWGALRRPALYGGLLVYVLLMAPWWAAMWRAHGNPLHSTQNHVSAFYGMGRGWEEGFYRIHWGRDLPGAHDRLAQKDAWRKAARRNVRVFLHRALKPEAGHGMRRRPLLAWLHGFAIGWGLLALVLTAGLRIRSSCRRRPPTAEPAPSAVVEGWFAGSVPALLVLAHAGFVIVLWSAEQPRMTLPVMPLLTVLGLLAVQNTVSMAAAAASGLGRHLMRRHPRAAPRPDRLGRWRPVSAMLLAAAVAGAGLAWHGRWHAQTAAGIDFPAADRYPRYHSLALALQHAGLPSDAVIMARNPWELLFYLPDGIKGVGLPNATPDAIFAVARYYGVTHFVHDCERPGLRDFLRVPQPGLRLMLRRPMRVYAIDWDAAAPDPYPFHF